MENRMETMKKKYEEDDVHPNKPKRRRVKNLISQIKNQLEFYFSDANLRKDRFLKQHMDSNEEGFVDVDVLLLFNKLKSLSEDSKLIVRAAIDSTLLKVNLEGNKIGRKKPLSAPKYNIDDLTVYAECLPSNTSHEWLKTVFDAYGTVTYVSIPRYKTTGDIKGFAFIEFSTPQEAQLACKKLNNPPDDVADRPGRFPKTVARKFIPGITGDKHPHQHGDIQKEIEDDSRVKKRRKRSNDNSSSDESDAKKRKKESEAVQGPSEKTNENIENDFVKDNDRQVKEKPGNRKDTDKHGKDKNKHRKDEDRKDKDRYEKDTNKDDSQIKSDGKDGNKRRKEDKPSKETDRHKTDRDTCIKDEEKLSRNQSDNNEDSGKKDKDGHGIVEDSHDKNKDKLRESKKSDEQKRERLTKDNTGISKKQHKLKTQNSDESESDDNPDDLSKQKHQEGKSQGIKRKLKDDDDNYKKKRKLQSQVVEVKKKRKRNKLKKKKADRVKEKSKITPKIPQMRVIPKKEWLELRNEYLQLQKANMSQLKKDMAALRGKQYEKKRIPIDQENQEKITEMPFTEGVVVKVKSSKPISSKKVLRELFAAISPVAYIDFKDEDTTGFVRFQTQEGAKLVVEQFSPAGKEAKLYTTLLKGDDEKKYWEKINLDRNTKLSSGGSKKKRCKKKGIEKVLAKASRLSTSLRTGTASHIRFQED
ncbi:LOW QUALITY PROTEIN: la-related protein 7-like [Saccoglossus kowalevskii]